MMVDVPHIGPPGPDLAKNTYTQNSSILNNLTQNSE